MRLNVSTKYAIVPLTLKYITTKNYNSNISYVVRMRSQFWCYKL
jgi:hypothetical protein